METTEPQGEPQDPTPPIQGVSSPGHENLIQQANEAAERLEKANKQLGELLTRQEALTVQRTLTGKAEAGKGNVEETPQEYRDRVLKGDI